MMLPVLLGIAVVAPTIATFIYKHNGKKQVFNLDMVQFTYLFVIIPTMFVWGKTFLFFLLRSELNLSLSINQLFFIDTAFTVGSFFLISAVAIHALTKTFWLRRRDDPKFDVYHLSEYFHLWWSHIAMFVGGMVLLTFISIVNVMVPLTLNTNKSQLYAVMAAGFLLGLLVFVSSWMSDPKQNHGNFIRMMKMFYALFFFLHVFVYFWFDPRFSISYGGYWLVFMFFLATVLASIFFERSSRITNWRDGLLHLGWGNNIQLKGK